MESRYHIIKSENELNQLINACKTTKMAAVDFETNAEGIYRTSFKPTILSVSFQPGSGISIPLQHFDSPFKKHKWKKFLIKFGREVVENPEIVKYAQNWKFDNQIFVKYGIFSRGTVIDTMLAKYILNEERPHGLKEMVAKYLPDFAGYEKKDDFDKIPWDKKPLESLSEYGCMDTDATLRLGIFFEAKLIKHKLYTLYRQLIMPASNVLQHAEARGLLFDKELNLELHTKYESLIEQYTSEVMSLPVVQKYEKKLKKTRIQKYLESIQAEIEELRDSDKKSAAKSIKNREQKISRILAGEFITGKEKKLIEPLNLGSQSQLVGLMYTDPKGLRFPILKYTKDKKSKKESTNPSTDEETLLNLKQHDKGGFIVALLKLRGFKQNYNTFIKGYRELPQSDGRIHPKFNIQGTVTGRLSSSDPNAQQIPKKEVNPDIKRQFITPPDELLLGCDYSQAELRIMAHLSGDETLLEAFAKGWDPHLAIACQKYGEDYDSILPIYKDETHPRYKEWKVKRKQAKQIVFGCIYGIEAPKLSRQLSDPESGLVYTPDEAQTFLNDFFKEHPKVKDFMDNQKDFMIENGYVTTLFGRKRRCPSIYSENKGEYLEAVRQSFNAPCQSAASDMALFASILLYYEMRHGNLPYIPEVSTVHDAIYFYSKPEFLNPWTIYQIYKICKDPDTKSYFGFEINDVSMDMDFTIGRNMVEDYPYAPGYDYGKMLKPDFDLDEYYEYVNKVKHIAIEDYPKEFPEYFTPSFVKAFRKQYTKIFVNQES